MNWRRTSRRQIGDTIIEVTLAITIFSLVAISAVTLMNRGSAMAQRSLEITLVRQQIDAQAEMLRFVHSRSQDEGSPYVQVWNNLALVTDLDQQLNVDTCSTSGFPSGGFALAATTDTDAGQEITVIKDNARYVDAPSYAKIDSDDADGATSNGLSIQLMKVSGDNSHAYDAYIQACWNSAGQDKPVTIGTIVRLYDSRI